MRECDCAREQRRRRMGSRGEGSLRGCKRRENRRDRVFEGWNGQRMEGGKGEKLSGRWGTVERCPLPHQTDSLSLSHAAAGGSKRAENQLSATSSLSGARLLALPPLCMYDRFDPLSSLPTLRSTASRLISCSSCRQPSNCTRDAQLKSPPKIVRKLRDAMRMEKRKEATTEPKQAAKGGR